MIFILLFFKSLCRQSVRLASLVDTFSQALVESAYQKINFIISRTQHMLWALKRTVSMRHLKHMLKLMSKKLFTILRSKFCSI